jgi:hypothetical protein
VAGCSHEAGSGCDHARTVIESDRESGDLVDHPL